MWKKLMALGLFVATPSFAAAKHTFDVVVYGGTASGVIASVAAARQGANVALVLPNVHVGGLVSNGLSQTDIGRPEILGGITKEFYQRVGAYYKTKNGLPDNWFVEPHVAEGVFENMLQDAHVAIFRKARLKEKGGVLKKGTAIREIYTEDGQIFAARVFIDATYEGDLMAFSGTSYTYGRESHSQYNEYSAGVREDKPQGVSAYDAHGHLLGGVLPKKEGKEGDGDKKTQSYNFRVCITNRKDNLTPWPKPEHYDPSLYDVYLARLLKTYARVGDSGIAEHEWHPRLRVNDKVDSNYADFFNANWGYPDGTYAERAKIIQAHIDYGQGFFYFLSHDPRVPQPLRDAVGQWGLAKDEFTDNNGWPHEMYVREGRRMIGVFVMTQKDVVDDMHKPDSIAMGSYGLDAHQVQQYADDKGIVAVEGTPQRTEQVRLKHIPYQIPYRSLTPKETDTTNLLVSVCMSASHVAMTTIRMEPQYMMMGNAAGVAAAMAAKTEGSVQEVDVTKLQNELRAEHGVLEMDVPLDK